jgi:hypothetical protein
MEVSKVINVGASLFGRVWMCFNVHSHVVVEVDDY